MKPFHFFPGSSEGLRTIHFHICLTVFIILAGVTACNKDDTEFTLPEMDDSVEARAWQAPDVVLTWNLAIQNLYTFPLGTGYPPPMVMRQWAMYHLAMHDALNCITPRYATYAGVPRDKKANADAAVSQAVYDMLVALQLPGQNLSSMEALLHATLDAIPDGDQKDRGIALGHAVTSALLSRRAADVSLVMPNYTPIPAQGSLPGEYRYLPPFNYAFAGLDLVEPFFIESQDQFRADPPNGVSSATYVTEYDEVKSLGSLDNSTRTADQTEIALFWGENPNRAWNEVAREVIANRPYHSMNAWKVARLLALIHAGMMDSGVAAFEGMKHYYMWRPLTAIRLGDTDGNELTQGDPIWQSHLPTAAIPEYPGTYSHVGATAAAILIDAFGKDNYPIVKTSGFVPDVTRSYPSISAVMHENTVSRIYAGASFRSSTEAGENKGFELGLYVSDTALPDND